MARKKASTAAKVRLIEKPKARSRPVKPMRSGIFELNRAATAANILELDATLRDVDAEWIRLCDAAETAGFAGISGDFARHPRAVVAGRETVDPPNRAVA